MNIPEFFVWHMDGGCTAVKIYCAEDLRMEIASRFTEVFHEEYEKVLDLVEKENGNCTETENHSNPFRGAQIKDYGVYLPFGALALYYGDGNILAYHDAGEALMKALKKVKKEFSSIRYEGYVAYSWSDIHGGEVWQYEITSGKGAEDRVYDFVGEALAEVLQSDAVWEELKEYLEYEEEEFFKDILKLFRVYSQWIPAEATRKLIDISEDAVEVSRENLESFLKELNCEKDPI